MSRKLHTNAKQRGIALLTALMVLALAAIFAFSLMQQSTLALDRAAGGQRAAQARALAEGLFDYAQLALQKDDREAGGTDHRGEAWAQPLPAFPVPQGLVTGRMEDLDGRLNLNGFADVQKNDGSGVEPGSAARKKFTRDTLARLLTILGRDPRIAERIEDAIDGDDAANASGGEDVDFLSARPPSRAPNRALTHLSELRALPGVSAQDWTALTPFVCVLPLPRGGSAPGAAERGLNVNTAKWQVLQSLDAQMDESMAKRLYSEGKASFTSITEFVTQLSAVGGPNLSEVQNFLVVHSSYFQARAQIRLDLIDYRYSAVIERNAGVLWRAQSPD